MITQREVTEGDHKFICQYDDDDITLVTCTDNVSLDWHLKDIKGKLDPLALGKKLRYAIKQYKRMHN